MKTDCRTSRGRHSLSGHLMKTCLARRRLLDDHQLARFDQVPQGTLSRVSVRASNVDHTTNRDPLKEIK